MGSLLLLVETIPAMSFPYNKLHNFPYIIPLDLSIPAKSFPYNKLHNSPYIIPLDLSITEHKNQASSNQNSQQGQHSNNGTPWVYN
jgi:hypothetical protein